MPTCDTPETPMAAVGGFALPMWASVALRGVPQDASRRFVEAASQLSANAGAVLYGAEEPPPVVLFVARGTVRAQMAAGARPFTIALLGPGDVVGEMGVLDADGRYATVTTVEPTTLAVVSRATFARALDEVPGLARNIAGVLSLRLRGAYGTIASLASMEVDRRVARQLLAFGARYGTADGNGIRVSLRLTQRDLASLVGASRERTNRALVAFKRRGWISVDRDCRVTLTRPDLLAKRVSSRF